MSLFSTPILRRTAVATIACFSLLTTGCFNYVHIEPEEAEKLDGLHRPTPVGSTYNYTGGQQGMTTIYQTPVVNVERKDGRIYQVSGGASLIIRTMEGRELMFKSPLSVEANPVRLEVGSKNRTKTKFYVSEIEDVVVKDYDEVDTTLLVGGISLAVSGVITGIVLAATPRI
jgi:hypothetical protein